MLTMVTIHRNTGETATVASIDARFACQTHPGEWSYTPFTTAQIKAAERKRLETELAAPARR